ncbi:flagellar basal-body rod protein FlgC [Gemmobacter caeni]|uniref:Flagellar basal-body rod protein FlgC n=1 Tax=Gemmobacter caeni TaxID=589035 RepID=A0A2T6AR20_9RHOB|nr:flagellar basal body rod protein FlgC [Gemmobacter caeni]PTX46196.1 flagellar basal-body rod protein FlgC [Gemmobacter caeni]TWI94439.1 flagellar basal-body rod protein FlgC [Gemmobacter caeni]
MSDLLNALLQAASGMQAQAARLRHVSENMANVDTPGYHRKLISFREIADGSGVEPGPVRLDRSALNRIYAPGHPLADETGHYDGSNVDLVVEVADAREAQRSYEANLKLFDQARRMTQSLFDLLRK